MATDTPAAPAPADVQVVRATVHDADQIAARIVQLQGREIQQGA